jgi:hypothetical protein
MTGILDHGMVDISSELLHAEALLAGAAAVQGQPSEELA